MTDPALSPVAAAALGDHLRSLLRGWGVAPQDAAVVADTLVEADLRGVDSHGAHLMRLYAARLEAGHIRASSELATIEDSGAVVRLDANLGLGQVAAVQAIDLAVERAGRHGLASVAVREITHVGALGYYTRRAAERGYIALAFQNGAAFVPPFGGTDGIFSTNPFSYAVPAGEEADIVYDVATTAAAGNKILLARNRGDSSIPEGWANDDAGNPTTDPLAASIGQLQWFGGHKGFGLGLMVEVLSGLLADSSYGRTENTASPLHGADRVAKGCTFIAIDVGRFLPVDEFRSRVDTLICDVHASAARPGFDRVYVPGELEHRTRDARLRDGIPLTANLVADLNDMARPLGVAPLGSAVTS